MIKKTIRQILIKLKLDITKNIKYDRLTELIMKQIIHPNSNCIDIGCHKGEMLDLMLKYAPKGEHLAFEPIPVMYNHLTKKYHSLASVYPYALSNKNGKTEFQYVKNAPAYSGIKRRKYDIKNPDIEEISVELKKLDTFISESKIDFIKIDVEGAELQVLQGAEELLKKDKPAILFECGKGASDYYNTHPEEIFQFLTENIGLKIYTLQDYIHNKTSMTQMEFERYFETNAEYYFLAV